MNLLYTIFLFLILATNSEEEKEPVIDDEFCNKKLAECRIQTKKCQILLLLIRNL